MKFIKSIPYTHRVGLLLAGASATVLFASTAAYAQEPYWLDGITILATKTEERAIDALAAVSTVRKEQMRQLMPDTPQQLFFGVPGVSSEATAQDPATAINIRGLQDFGRVAVVIDGARQNYARAGHDGSGSFFLEPETLAEADVIRGPVANIYGSGAIGGVVSFRTKDVEDILRPGEKWGAESYGELGSNAFNRLGSLFGAFRAGPNAEFIVGGTIRKSDNYEDGSGNEIANSGRQIATGLAKATFRPADGHTIKFGGLIYDADWENGTPGTSSVVHKNKSLNTTTTANWRYSKPEDRLFDFNQTAYWNRTDVDQRVLSVTGGGIPFYGPVGTRDGYVINTLGYDGNNTTRFDTGEIRHAFTYGGDIFNDKVDTNSTAGFGSGFNPTGERQVWGGFAQLKSTYRWLQIISALRYDNYSLNGINSNNGQRVQNGGDRVSPKITVGVSPVEWFTFYGTYAEGYRAPAVTETLIAGVHPFPPFTFLPNPNLKPEVGKNKELGINIKRDDLWRQGDRWRLKANVFRNDVDDFIDSETFCAVAFPFCWNVFADPSSGPDWTVWNSQYQNVAKARIEGVELESIYDAGGWFAGLSGHRIRGKDLTEGDPLGKIPPDMIAATFGLRSADQKWTAALRWAHFAAKKRSDLPNSTSSNSDTEAENVTGSYNLVNLYLAYQPNENVTAALSVENLLNESYRVYTHEYNSPGITVKGSLRMRFAGGVPPLEDKPVRK